jgi:hypothetical protein
MPPGSVRLRSSANGALFGWVLPGPLQDDLVRQGAIAPVS